MEKTNIEKFLEEHGLCVEITIKKDKVGVMLYKDTDLYLYSTFSTTLNEAMDKAAKEFFKRKDLQ